MYFFRLRVIIPYVGGVVSLRLGVVFLKLRVVVFLTNGGYKFLCLWVAFLKVVGCIPYVWGLDFSRLRVRNPYVWGLQIVTFVG